MDNYIQLNGTMSALMDALGHPATWAQVMGIALAIVMAWLLQAYLSGFLSDGDRKRTRIRHITMRTLQRLLFPFTTLIFVVITRFVIQLLGIETPLLDIAVPLLLALAAARLAIYIIRKSFAPSPVIKAWENTIATVIWAGFAMHILGWLPAVTTTLDAIGMNVGQTHVSILWIIKLTASIGFFLVFALWASKSIEKRVHTSKHFSASMKIGLSKGLRIVLLLAAFLIALDTLGVDLTALTVFGGALGVGLGFGLQRIASNFISGFILLFDRSIRPGDVITIGNSFGWVKELHARYVVVQNREGVETLIPNENLITSEVINWSYSDRNVRLKTPVQISYNDDPEVAMKLMLDIARATPRVLQNPEPTCRLTNFADSGMELELRVWLKDPESGLGSLKSEINLAIWRAFKENGITIPYPQRDVHIKNTQGGAAL